MLAPHPGAEDCRGAMTPRLGALLTALPPALGGCSASTSGAAWLFASLALLLASAGAYLAGTLGERRRGERALRAARAELRLERQLEAGWTWRTDGGHRLVAWQGPGASTAADCPLFGAALHARLAHQQPFHALRVIAPRPLEGSAGWELSGVPCFDDLGRFDGCTGTARPTDGDDALRAAAAALGPTLAACAATAVVALDRGEGWRVLHASTRALERWPALRPGERLDALLAELPATLREACAQAEAGTPQALQGWQLQGFGPLADGSRGLVLAQPASAGSSADAQETENFGFTVSHDLRAPIRVVEGFTRIVKEDYGRLLDRVGNDHLDRVLGAATRMNLMIDALMTLARLSSQPLARQPVNLSQLAGYVVDDLRRAAPEREADIEIEPDLGAVGDPTLLRLVLENLLGNAWKYSSRCARAQIAFQRVMHGSRPAFVVRDNGAGFDMRSADRLFGLFQRLHSASEFPGTGVGLASVRRIVRRHGGELWADAEPGRGASFFFTLPG
ncbi:sensor histidine kinase [Rubrivivax sp. A210]|uniref:sensor histidine kinase n=1 Tax=Rubrivivax sp. A210 TaxID=2772301 RepID=UPI001919B860|nr:ATP-binding protein [Rubrivivax sp. A210]